MTDTGFNVRLARADLVVSATDVAITDIVWLDVIDEGAVYRPAEEIVPTAELRDQVTEVLAVPDTVAENDWV